MRRLISCFGLVVACLAAPAGPTAAANPGTPGAVGAAKPTSSVGTDAPKPSLAAGEPKQASSLATPPARKRVAPAAERSGSGPRTLEDIHIEGEIPVPQVLFVTARDQRRFTQFHHRRYLKSSLEVGRETVLPSRIVLTRRPPSSSSPQ